jgi:hypothetical protein
VAGSIPGRRKAETGGDVDFKALIASGACFLDLCLLVSFASSAKGRSGLSHEKEGCHVQI